MIHYISIQENLPLVTIEWMEVLKAANQLDQEHDA
jgi:hypothetical protein